MKILGVNGIWSHGRDNIDKLLAVLAWKDFKVKDIYNVKRGPFWARFKADNDACPVIKESKPGDAIVAHSYGCLKALEAAKYVNYKALFLIAPAASKDYDMTQIHPDTKIYCLYSKKDWAVKLGSLLLFHPFGLAGCKGFTDPRVENLEYFGDHGHYFNGEVLHKVANFIHKELK